MITKSIIRAILALNLNLPFPASASSPGDRFESCCAPFLSRLGPDAAWDAVRQFVGRVAAVDFATAVALLQAESPRRFFRYTN